MAKRRDDFKAEEEQRKRSIEDSLKQEADERLSEAVKQAKA